MKILLNVLKYIFFLGIGILLLYLALRNLSWDNIIQGFKNANYFYVVLAMTIGLISHFIRAVRWNLLIETLGHKVSAGNSFIAVLVGYMVNFALPRMGEISRCVILNRSNKIPLDKLIGTVLIERIFDAFVLVLILILTFFVQFSYLEDLFDKYLIHPFQSWFSSRTTMSWLILFFIIAALILVFIFSIRFIRHKAKTNKVFSKIQKVLSGFYSGIKTIVTLKRKWSFLMWTLCIWLCYWMMAYTLFKSTETTAGLGLGAGLSALSIGSVGMVIPTPGGVGSWHYAVTLALSFYKPLLITVDNWKKACGIYSLISHESQMIFLIIAGAIAYIIFLVRERKQLEE